MRVIVSLLVVAISAISIFQLKKEQNYVPATIFFGLSAIFIVLGALFNWEIGVIFGFISGIIAPILVGLFIKQKINWSHHLIRTAVFAALYLVFWKIL